MTLPIQEKRVTSKLAAPGLSSGAVSAAPCRPPMTVPSRSAALLRKFAARTPPAPGICCTMKVGRPGMYRGKYWASIRA